MIYLKYLKSLLRHKWFVFLECLKAGMPLVGLVHDWSKFLPSEFIPYAQFFGVDRRNEDGDYIMSPDDNQAFLVAWLKHQHRNPHHWQHWILVQDTDPTVVLPMPNRYLREMVCDWRGAGRAYTGKDNTVEWYLRNRDNMTLHPDTRLMIELYVLDIPKSERPENYGPDLQGAVRKQDALEYLQAQRNKKEELQDAMTNRERRVNDAWIDYHKKIQDIKAHYKVEDAPSNS